MKASINIVLNDNDTVTAEIIGHKQEVMAALFLSLCNNEILRDVVIKTLVRSFKFINTEKLQSINEQD